MTAPKRVQGRFRIEPRGIQERHFDGDEHRWKSLCTVPIRIARDIEIDDGVSSRRDFEIEYWIRGERRTAVIPADEFGQMKWILPVIGSAAIVPPRSGQRLLQAIQTLSDPEEVRFYGHTGWRTIDGHRLYLHAGGALGSDGNRSDVAVRLHDRVSWLHLPAPPAGDGMIRAVRASLEIPLTNPRLWLPYGYLYRSILGHVPTTVIITGPSGAGKTSLALILQQHLSTTPLTDQDLVSFGSTRNAIEGLLHIVRDAMLVIDDLHPVNQRQTVEDLQKLDAILRMQADRAARDRLGQDLSIQAARIPNGGAMVTAESDTAGHSAAARRILVFLPWDHPRSLSPLQSVEKLGMYPEAMAGFIAWCAGREIDPDQRVRVIRSELAERLRVQVPGVKAHARVPDAFAHVMLGIEVVLEYAVAVTAICDDERQSHLDTARNEIARAAKEQAAIDEVHDPAAAFREALRSLIAGKTVHVCGLDGGRPRQYLRYGWHEDVSMTRDGDSVHEHGVGRTRTDAVGWTDEIEWLYLDMKQAYRLVRRHFPELPLPDENAVRRAMAAKGWVSRPSACRTGKRDRSLAIASGKDRQKEQRLSVQITVAGQRFRALKVPLRFLEDGDCATKAEPE